MQKNSDFTRNVAKRFCLWCGTPIVYSGFGRPRKFCSNRCRWSFDKYRQNHEEMFDEDSRIEGASGIGSEACRTLPPEALLPEFPAHGVYLKEKKSRKGAQNTALS
jgi:endogenous inhibitor of DNA gyrase (YacG/DUF329 family)